jgi:hypothetical protein
MQQARLWLGSSGAFGANGFGLSGILDHLSIDFMVPINIIKEGKLLMF